MAVIIKVAIVTFVIVTVDTVTMATVAIASFLNTAAAYDYMAATNIDHCVQADY